jgi:hypothetical protein
MLEFFTKNNDDAINILKQDHDKVKDLFDDFEKAEKRSEKKKIIDKAIMELKIHATIEEEFFYPALRGQQEVDQELLNEAHEEHHVAKMLIAELDDIDETMDSYDAKFTVLAENIRHHIKEEEDELFPQARQTELDFEAMGNDFLTRKQQLKKTGVPASDEEKMIFGSKKSSKSSAKVAKPKKTAKKPVRQAAKAVKKSSSAKSSGHKASKKVYN